MSGLKKFVSDTMIYGLTTIISRTLGFVITPILTRNFTEAAYGIFTHVYAYVSLVNAVLAFGMETTFFRYLQNKEGDKQRVYDSSFFVTLLMTAIFLITIFTFSTPIAMFVGERENISDYTTYVKIVGLIVAADALAVIPFAKLRADGRPIRYGVIKLVNIFTYLGFVLLFLYGLPWLTEHSSFWKDLSAGWFRKDWLGNIFLANLAASLVTFFMLMPQLLSFRFRVDTVMLRKMLTYSFPIMIANISFIINENLDKMMFPKLIPGIEGDRELGVYGAVTKLAVFLNLFVMAFRLGAEPFFFSYAKNENAKKTYAMIMRYFVLAMILVMIGICANLDWLKSFIRGKTEDVAGYWEGLFIVPVLLFNYVLLGIYINLSVWYKLSDQTRYGLYISGIGALMTIVLNLLLIPKYSYTGAALSTTVAYFTMVILSYVWGQKNYPIPYESLKIAAYLLIGVVLSFIAYQLNFWFANVLFLAVLGVVAYSERELIKRFIRR